MNYPSARVLATLRRLRKPYKHSCKHCRVLGDNKRNACVSCLSFALQSIGYDNHRILDTQRFERCTYVHATQERTTAPQTI